MIDLNKQLEDKYIVLDMVPVSQLQNGIVFTGKMKFGQLNQIFRLTERPESVHDPFGNSRITFDPNSRDFQRQLSQKKLGEIVAYLKEELGHREKGKSLAMFPSSLILYNRAYESGDIENDSDDSKNDLDGYIKITKEEILESYKPDLDCCFYLPSTDNSEIYKLYVPKNKNITLIVDGQHRFIGTRLFYSSLSKDQKDLVEDFEFIVTYLVGFDLYEVGQIFATVNFNQKPVNRSLYYDIFGSAPQTDRDGKLRNDIRLAHDLALHLNNNEESPIYSMIKLLGKGFGLFSQAFFVDKMIRFVFRSGVWDDQLMDYLKGGKDYRVIAQFMKDYFSALKDAYPTAWPTTTVRDNKDVYSSYYYKYILCKTTGLGAYFRLIRDIYPLVKEDPSNFRSNIFAIFSRLTDDEAKRLFEKNGDYGGAGSEGLQDKLYRNLKYKYGL